ncbi:N-acetyltransferase [Propioniciclava sinopodophylli]|uniref:N-acetyltransferase n=1 Tax=Propioniciclava sinopodophylli TaxID=1837344 RepID=A0A4Q9KCK6_9ACTN|nr:GNAT family protein [Propioniciclava sinopodophylli]TBT83326.1 N-acetyltransferase [Propioniciclava sinopodophylli]
MHPRLAEIFPPLGLRITRGPLELRGIGDEEMLALLRVVQGGIHAPERMPFLFPWTDASPQDLPFKYLQWWARGMATWSREAWALDLCALWEGEVVGVQGVATSDFLTFRYGETGSWLGSGFQGRGIGTAMRQALCAFLFDHLDFEFITSVSFEDNPGSLRVSEKLGYRDNGIAWSSPRGTRATSRRLLLLPEDFVRGEPITVEGAEPLRRFIGLEQAAD